MPLDPDIRHPLRELTPSRRVVVYWTVLGTVLTLLATLALGLVYALGTGQTDVGFQLDDGSTTIDGVVATLLLVVVILGLHEGIHAAAIRYFGGDVSAGLGVARFVLPYAYVTTSQRLSRNQYVLVAFAPFVLITVIGVPLMIVLDAPLLILPLALNAGGAIGDLWMTGILLRYPAHVVVEDSATGVTIYGRRGDEVPATSEPGLLKRVIVGTVGGFGLLVLVGIATPVVLGALGVDAFTIGIPDSPWSIYSLEGSASEFGMNVNFVGLAATSVFVGCLYAVGVHYWRR